MASHTTIAAEGYDCNWVSEPPHSLKCLICLCVARDPRQHPGEDGNECGKIFCFNCIQKLPNKTCPNCRGALNTFKDVSNARRIKELKVKCENLDNGCSWTGELGSLDDHLQECGYALVPCTNECRQNVEIFRCLRKNLENHLKADCPRREYRCPHCRVEGEYEEMVTTHLATCPEVREKCPNDLCQAQVSRCEVVIHRVRCDYERVSCKYEEVGCEEKPLRKDLKNHEDDERKHLQLAKEELLSQRKSFLLLQNFVVDMAEQINMKVPAELLPQIKLMPKHMIEDFVPQPLITVELKNFQQLKNGNKKFYSQPFHTSKDGYKLRMKILPGGWGSGEGTHVSVYSSLMKGLNDDSLDWPFLGKFKIELIDQLHTQKNNHYFKITKYENTEECTKYNRRVTEGIGGVNGWGQAKFIPHADLGHNQENNCQYLKDDKLIFKVYVEEP